jgi:acetyl esterase/lipase
LFGLGLAIALVAAGLAAFVSPPRWLSVVDGLAGGGRGVSKVASGVAFGTQGQRLDVWRPDGPADKRLPVVIFYYGGGWVKGTRGAYAFAARAYASQGFVVVVPDYRKVPGVRFPAFLQDAADAVRWTRDHVAEHGGDPDRISLAGHSAGAYAAAMLALDARWLSAVGLPRETIKASIGLSGPYDFYPFTSKRAIDAMHGVADPRMTQPIAFASAAAPPMLLVTSSADVTVRPRNADRLAARLRAVGARVQYSNHQGLSHEDVVMALSKPFRGKAPVLAESVAFLRTALK